MIGSSLDEEPVNIPVLGFKFIDVETSEQEVTCVFVHLPSDVFAIYHYVSRLHDILSVEWFSWMIGKVRIVSA